MNPKESSMSLSWLKGYISEKEEKVNFSLSSSMEMTHQMTIVEPKIFKILYNQREFDIYAEPGDALQFSFEGDKFPESLLFTGSGASHNMYLRKYFEVCKLSNERVVTSKINELSPKEFKEWLQRFYQLRLDFYKNYDEAEKNLFTPSFNQYALSEIEYWRAYHLLRYKEQHEKGGRILQSSGMSEQYFEFLNQTMINNDDAMLNANYRRFIEQYVKYKADNPTSKYGIAANQIWVKVKFPELELLDSPYQSNSIGKVYQGEKLLVISKLDYGGQYGLPVAYRLKVRTMDGREGWMKTYGLEIVPEKTYNNRPIVIEEIEQTYRKMAKVAVVDWDNLRLLNNVTEQDPVTTLFRTSELIYQHEATDEKYPYKIDGASSVTDIYHKVQTPDGKTGWVVAPSVHFVEKEFSGIKTYDRISASTSTVLNNLDYFLAGKALIYAIGKDIKNRLYFENADKIKPELDAFYEKNLDKEVTEDMQNIISNRLYGTPDINAQTQADRRVVTTRTYSFMINSIRFRLDDKVPSGVTTVKSSPKPTLATTPNPSTTAETPKQTTVITDNSATKTEVKTSSSMNISPSSSNYSLKKTIVKGNISNTNGSDLKLDVLADYVNMSEKSYSVEVRADNGFSSEVYLSEPIVGELIYGQDSIPVWLSPSDSVSIDFSGVEGGTKTLSCTGKGANQVNFLAALKQFSKRIEAELKVNIKASESVAFKSFLDNARKEKFRFFNEYVGNQSFSEDFKKYIESEINYWYAFQILNYPWEHPLYYDEAAPMKLPASYYEGLKAFPLQNDDALSSRNYRYYIEQHIANLKGLPENSYLSKDKIAENNFKDKTLAFLKAKFITEQLAMNPTPKVMSSVNDYIASTPYPLYTEFVKNAFLRNAKPTRGLDAPDFRLFNAEGKEVSLKSYAGKVVHIDFWASWCGPCIKAMKTNEELIKRFNPNEVVFLYINVEDKHATWMRFIEERELDKSRHLLGVNQNPYILDVSLTYKSFKLPTVYVIDKQGKIAIDNSEKLATDRMAEKISYLLK